MDRNIIIITAVFLQMYGSVNWLQPDHNEKTSLKQWYQDLFMVQNFFGPELTSSHCLYSYGRIHGQINENGCALLSSGVN